MDTFIINWIIVLSISLILTVISCIIWNKTEKEWMGFIAVPLILFTVFGGVFSLIPQKEDQIYYTIKRIYPSEITKSKTTVFVEFEDRSTMTYNSKEEYDEITDSTKFYEFSYYDHYHRPIDNYDIVYGIDTTNERYTLNKTIKR